MEHLPGWLLNSVIYLSAAVIVVPLVWFLRERNRRRTAASAASVAPRPAAPMPAPPVGSADSVATAADPADASEPQA